MFKQEYIMGKFRNPLCYHIFWAAKYRHAILSGELKAMLETEVPKIAERLGAEVLACAIHEDDHIHLVVNLSGSDRVDDFMRDLKSWSGRIANRKMKTSGSPFWQKRYLARTVASKGQTRVIQYVNRYKNQEGLGE
jgi:REP element-mobilizing transposase RayT